VHSERAARGINAVTSIWKNILRAQLLAVCSNVKNLLRIQATWASLPTNPELRFADDAEAVELAVITHEVTAASPSFRRVVEPSTLSQSVEEPEKSANTTSSNDANHQQFQVALLESCSFFASLVLRHVRAGRNPTRCVSDRAFLQKQLNDGKGSQRPPRSGSSVLPRGVPVDLSSFQPEVPIFSWETLWVEVGFRISKTLVSERNHHEYGKDPKPAP
jgi:hypothetical protein